MKEKKWWIIGGIILVFLVCLIGVKWALIKYLNINDDKGQYYEFLEILNNKTDIFPVKHIDSSNTLKYQEFSMQNDLEEFEKNTMSNSWQYNLKDGNIIKASVTISKGDTFRGLAESLNNKSLNRLLKNIKTDKELFEYIKKDDKDISIFSSFNTIFKKKALQLFVNIMYSRMNSLTLLEGDYEGFIFNQENVRLVYFYKDEKVYVISFRGLDYFTDNYIKQLINTMKIE